MSSGPDASALSRCPIAIHGHQPFNPYASPYFLSLLSLQSLPDFRCAAACSLLLALRRFLLLPSLILAWSAGMVRLLPNPSQPYTSPSRHLIFRAFAVPFLVTPVSCSLLAARCLTVWISPCSGFSVLLSLFFFLAFSLSRFCYLLPSLVLSCLVLFCLCVSSLLSSRLVVCCHSILLAVSDFAVSAAFSYWCRLSTAAYPSFAVAGSGPSPLSDCLALI